ncbi:HAD family hydrolase [Aspergillus undulatus]|uniref:HAD family hydrolase n=1 Tax=Aspergillus undulatus TaxID=1810928 RepID=UPI003CCD242B
MTISTANPTVQRFKTIQWVAFDLDDTIHEFRSASSAASQAVFDRVRQHTSIPVETLQTDYRAILATHTANAFSDGKTSTEYRRDRFEALLRGRDIEASEESLQSLLTVYKSSLAASLKLRPGALETIQALKRLNKSILVITEGPRDAQEWTLERLGLSPYVDILVTSNEVGRTKADGLVGEAIRDAGLDPKEGIYMGDNRERDVLPAIARGIEAVHYDEGLRELEYKVSTDGYISVNSWPALARLFGLFDLHT